VKRCGLYQGAGLVKKGGTQSLKGLRKTLFTKPAQWMFEMDVKECTDDLLAIDFHYCPLVKAWQKQGCSDEEIALLCDIAMCGRSRHRRSLWLRAGASAVYRQGRPDLRVALCAEKVRD